MNPLFFLFILLGAQGMSSTGGSARTTEVELFTSEVGDDDNGDGDGDGDDDSVITGSNSGDDVTPPPPPQPITPEEPPQAPDQSGDGGAGGETTPIMTDGTISVVAGRVATLAPSDNDLTEVRVVEGVDHGTVTANPDGTFALVMTKSDFTGSQSFTYEATHSDGSTTLHEVGLDVVPDAQEGGWGTGEHHYMLATDDDGRVVVEHGDIHTKVYISGSTTALSLEDIATREGLSVEQITGGWLANSDYGQTEELALDTEAGLELWKTVTPAYSSTSNWLLFERGYQYDLGNEYEEGRLLQRATFGEDELHPLYVSAWGDGDKPEVTSKVFQFQQSSENLVIQDIHFSGGLQVLDGANIIFDNNLVTDKGIAFQSVDGVTVRNSQLYDIHREVSVTDDVWEPHPNRESGLYVEFAEGLLIENLFVDQVGWENGYDPDGSLDSPQPPSQYSQNIYLHHENDDVTLRDTISMRAASVGAQVRSGGFIEDNVFLDNNIAMNALGGLDGTTGNYSLISDNLTTSGAQKWAYQIGGLSGGMDIDGSLTTLVDNIVAHMADPNNPNDLIPKKWAGNPLDLRGGEAYYDDTIIWNWEGWGNPGEYPDQNVDGLDTAALDQTTIQIFTAQLLGDEHATIDDLAAYLRSQDTEAFEGMVDADLIIQFFQNGFGIAPDIRTEAETLRFVPSDLGDGVRWDNRLNWESEDLPGTVAGDSVDLGGNHVVYGTNSDIDTLTFSDGALNVYGGRLDVTGGITDGGHLTVEGAGQIWTNGHSGDDVLDIDVTGGRFANTGQMDDTDLTATGGQTILAKDNGEFDLGTGRTLAIFDAAAKVGFDDENGDMAVLDMHEGATLAYSAASGDLGTIEEFRSGALGEAPDVLSGIDLGGVTLEIDLTGLSADVGTEFTLMDSDELVGALGETLVGGLGGRDATIVVDYVSDSVTLQLTDGTGQVSVKTVGEQSDVTAGAEDLWAALTADQGLAEDQALPGEEEELLEEA